MSGSGVVWPFAAPDGWSEVDVSVLEGGAAVAVGGRRLPSAWLWSISPAHFDSSNSQRVAGALPPADARVGSARASEAGLVLTFLRHEGAAMLPWSWISGAAAAPGRSPRLEWAQAAVPWPTGEHPAIQSFAFPDLLSPRVAAAARAALAVHGLLRVYALPPPVSGSDELGGVEALCKALGTLYETNYGRSFEVLASPAPINAAFAAGALAPHVDNPYRDPVPGFQALACRVAAGSGGATTFVDGFALAAALEASDPAAAATLALVPVAWGWGSAACALRAARPVLERVGGPSGCLLAVHWNDRAQRCPSPEDADAWFRAAEAWAALLHSPTCFASVCLAPGEGVVWDNRRLLHGREAYTDAPGGPPRWLSGAYISEDSVVGAWAAECGRGAW